MKVKSTINDLLPFYDIIDPGVMADIYLIDDEISQRLSVRFDSNKGFTIGFDDLEVESSDINFNEALNNFYLAFQNRIIYLTSQENLPDNQLKYLDLVKKLINNPTGLN